MNDVTTNSPTAPDDPSITLNAVTPAQLEIGWTQPTPTFGALVKKALPVLLANRKYMFLKTAFYIVIALFIGTSYYGIGTDATSVHTNVGCVFGSIVVTIIMGMLPTILTFPNEMSDFVRENPYQSSASAFYAAKMCVDIPFLIGACSFYSLTIYILTAQPYVFLRALVFVIICAMTALISHSLALFIAIEMSIKSETERAFIAIVIVVPFVLVAGYFESVPEIFKLIKLLSYVHYAFEGALIIIYGFRRNNFECKDQNCIYDHYNDPQQVLIDYKLIENDLSIALSALLLIFVALQTFAIVSLQWRTKSYRNR